MEAVHLAGLQVCIHAIGDAAAASLTDGETGTITEGKRADLVVLTGDPTGVPADEILSLEVELTVSGGREIFRR